MRVARLLKSKSAKQTVADILRQSISLIPLVVMFLLSKEETYLPISTLTSATTISSALLLLGVNFVVLLRDRREHIGLVSGLLVISSPLAFIVSFVIFSNAGWSSTLRPEIVSLVIFGEICYCHIQQVISRYALAEWRILPLVLGNLISPAVRALSFIGLIYENWQLIAAVSYFISQVVFTFGMFLLLGVKIDFRMANNHKFGNTMKIGIPNWLSGMVVTLIDNLLVLFLANLGDAKLAANLIFSIRVFGAANTPVQSVASIRLTSETRRFGSEVSSSSIYGLISSILGLGAIAFFNLLLLGNSSQILYLAFPLALFPLLRTMSTFIGNRLTQTGFHWKRVKATIAALVAFLVLFLGNDHLQKQFGSPMDAYVLIIGVEAALLLALLFVSRARGHGTQD
jgi:hypothetical protein